MSKSRRVSRRRFAVSAAIAGVMASVASNMASGVPYYWNTTTTGTWATGANWSDNATTGGITGVVPGAADTVIFNQSSVNGAEIVNVNAATSIAGITFQNTGTTSIQSTVASILSIGTSGLSVLSGAGAATIGGGSAATSLSLSGAQTWTNNSANLLSINAATPINNGGFLLSTAGTGPTTINSVMSGAGGFTVGGTGTVTLTGANTFTGATTINAGATLSLGNASSNSQILASGSAVTNNGTLIFAPGTTGLTYANVITQSATGSFVLSGTTASSPASITLSATTNNIGGSIILNQGRLVITALTNLGNAATPITINGSSTNGGQFWANAAIAIANPITFNGSAGPLEAAGNLGAIRGFNGASYTGVWTLASGNSALNPESGNTFTVSGPISGPGGLIIGTVSNNRGGAVTLSGANNGFSGGVQVSGATLNANAAGTLGLGPVTLNNFSNTAFTQSVANALAGTNSLTINGGTATLSFANSYGGGTTVAGGSLLLTAAGATGGGVINQTGGLISSSVTAAGTYPNIAPLNISGGLLVTPAAGGNFQNVNLSSAGTFNPGGQLTVGSMTINNLTTTGGVLQLDLPSATLGSYDQLNLLGTTSFGAGTSLSFLTVPALGTYQLISYTGATPSTANLALPSVSGQVLTWNTIVNPGFLSLVVSAGGTSGVTRNWTPTAAGTFSWGTAGNWGGILPANSGDTAVFNTALAGAQTVTLDGARRVGILTLSPTTAFAYTLSAGTGGSLLLDNGASAAGITNSTQNNTISAPITLVSADTTVSISSGTTLTLSGAIGGNGKLTFSGGAGTAVLSGSNTYRGGTEINSGTVTINGTFGTNPTPLNNQGIGTVILNGGTLNFSNTAGTTANPGTGFVINLGASGGTLNTGGATSGVGGKLNLQGTNFFTGSGQLTKTGGGDLQVGGPSVAFTGNVTLSNNGLVEQQSVAGLGFGNAAGFTGGSITLNGPSGVNAPELVSGGIQIFNPITLAGGTLSANGNNNALFNSTVNVTAASTLRASQFQGVTVANNFAIKTLTGSSDLAVNGSTTANAVGLVALGDATGYTGIITVGANAALGLSSGASALGGTITAFTNASSGIGLLADGTGNSTPETIAYTLPTQITSALFGTGNTTGYIVGRVGATTLSNQASNKIIAPTAALPLNNTAGNTLNVQAFNGYGLLLANQPALAANTTFGVGTVASVGGVAPGAQASNVTPALILTNLTGAFNITKTGASTLQLGINAADATNTFGTGVAGSITATSGIVSAFSDQNLGAAGNGVTLNNAQFLALNSFATSRTFTLAGATGNTLAAATGQTLTLNSGLAYTAVGNTLTKAENGTVILTAAATGAPTSTTAINAGALQISASNQIGTGAITVSNLGSSLILNTGAPTTFTQPISISAGGTSASIGALHNAAGANTLSGAVTIAGGTLITNADTSNTFTIGPVTNTTTGFNVGTPGVNSNFLFSGVISGAGIVDATGGTSTFTAANTTSGAFQAIGGTMILSGAAGSVGSGTVNVQYGGTLTLDNTVNNLNNRLSTSGAGASFHSLITVGGATFNLNGSNTVNSIETLLTLNVGRGQTNFNVTPGVTQQANLILTATGGGWTRNAFSTVSFNSVGAPLATAPIAGSATINTGSITAAANFAGAGTAQTGTANIGILPWAVANNNGTISLATSTVIGASGYLRNLAAAETTPNFVNSFNYGNGVPVISGTWLTTSNIINTTNTSGLFVGQAVSSLTGTGLPAGAFITAINPGVSVTINANTSAAQATAAGLTFTTAGANIGLLSGANNGPNFTLAQTINSLTLNAGATLNLINSNQVITVGSSALGGAVLALDPTANTISGGQITAGANELIFHAPAGVNLTVNSNIVGGGGGGNAGITKALDGTLTLTGTSFHSGQTIVNAGTLNLNNGNNTIRFANFTAMGTGATLQLNGNSQIFTDLFSDSGGLSGLGTQGGNSTVTGSAGATVVLRRDNTARNFTGQITGSAGLVVSGQNTWTLTQPQTYSGPTLINLAGGTVTLANNATILNSSSLTINRSTLALDNTGSVDLAVRLPAGQPISLSGGALSYLGRAQFTSTETVGAVTAVEGANTINVTNNTTGISSAQLTLTSLTRTAGATVNFTNTNGTLGTIGSNPLIFVTGATNTNGIMGGGYTVNGNDFAAYNPTYGVGALGTAGNQGYSPLMLNNASATDNVSNNISTGVAIGNLTVNSLRATGTVNVIQNAGTTLTLASGGLLAGGGALTIGTAFNGTTFTNAINQGNLTSGGSELFLLGGTNSTINSVITGSGVSVVKSGTNTWTLNGTNTYNGGTRVAQGTLTLANAGNVLLGQSTLGTGGIFLTGGNLTQTAGSIIPAQAASISGNSTLTTNSDLSVANAVTTLGSSTITLPSVNGIAVGQLVTGTGIPGNILVTGVNPLNNTVTVSSGSGVTAGTNTLTFRNLSNTLTNVTFNNNGGSSPTLTNTGLLNISSGSITALGNNVGGGSTASVNTLTGGNVDLNNVASPTITVNPISFNGQSLAPYQPTLVINSALQNANNAVQVTGGGNLQVGGASVFTGGVNLATGTSLTIAASSTNAASGAPLSGPLGTGTLSIGTGSTLYSTGALSVGNNVVVGGNFTFDAPSSAVASLALGAGSQSIALPASVATTITVNAPNMTGILNSSVTGAGSTIVKAGLGTLQLTNNLGAASTFTGGVLLNAGGLTATGVGASGTSLGSGPVILSGGQLALRHSGLQNNGNINFGNNVQINTALSNAFIDINNNGANTGNTLVMGTLDYGTVSGTTFTSTVAGNPAPGTVLNISGGNGYKLRFTGTTLTSATSSPTFNVGSGLFLILPGGFTVGTNLPTNIGPGTLSYSGSNTGASISTINGIVAVSPAANSTSTPLGAGPITLNAGSTLQISPVMGTLSTTGYSTGGGTAKYYFSNVAGPLNAVNYGIAPNSTLAGIAINDSNLRMSPFGVNNNGAAQNTMITYQALLNITTGGTYYFGAGDDDNIQVVVDGQTLQTRNGAGQALNQEALQSIALGSGTHTITYRLSNGGGGGGSYIYYAGPDTGANGLGGTPPVNFLQALPASQLSYATNYTLANAYQNAAIVGNAMTVAAAGSATIDGLGTDFNYAIPSLTLGAGSTLNVANGTGTAFGSAGNGVFVVTGLTDVSAGTGTLNQTTGTLVLAGGVTDGGLGLTKTGQGNLILASGGVFTGPLNISGGFVQLQDGGGLTTGTTTIGIATTTPATLDLNGQSLTQAATIVLNGGAGPAARSSNAPAGLYNSSPDTVSFFAGSTLSIGAPQTTGTVNASIGGFGDIDLTNVVVQDSVANSGLNKVGPNILTLGSSNTFTGAFNVTAGTVKLTSGNGFTSSATSTVTVSAGATVDLNGQTVTVAKPLNLNGAGRTLVSAPNLLGSLINSSASPATYPGNITLAGTTSIGGPSLQQGVNGGITLSGTFSGAQQITKVGGNNLTLTNGSNPATLIDVQAGSVTLNNTAALSAGGTAANFLRQNATLTLDNSTTAVSNRLGNRGLWLSGALNVVGNATTGVNETINTGGGNIAISGPGTFANGYGASTITLSTAGTAGVILSVNTPTTSTSIFNRGSGGTTLIRGDNLGLNAVGGAAIPAANTASIIGNGTALGLSGNNNQAFGQAGVWNAPNALVYPWAVADTSATGSGTGFAGYNGWSGAIGTGGIAGTAGNVQSNVFGVSSIASNANNALAASPTLTALNVNTTNANSTVTTTSTAGLQVGQLVNGTGIPANAVITAITNGTTFTISANATATANTSVIVYANPTTTFTGVTTVAGTTITVPSTANLYPGQMVAGVTGAGVSSGFIPNGTTIASITNGTTIVLSAAATAGTGNLVFGLPGYANISSTSATNSFGTSSAAQLINSLTLNSAGGTTSIASGLQLDSGGLIALQSATINSSNSYSYLTGSNTLNREMIFHTVGAGTTLTVNAPIFSNGSGLTKADAGTLVLGTQEAYLGDTVVSGGTLQLAGGNNTIFRPFTTGATPGNTAAGATGQNLTVNFGGTLDLNGTTQAVGNLRSGSGTQLAGGTVINSNAGAATLNVALNGNQTWAGNISNGQSIGTITGNTIGLTGAATGGTLNFVRDGNSTLTVNSPNTLGGSVTTLGGATTLVDLGTFQNASAVNVTRSALIWNDQGVQAVSNRLSSSAPITLTGGGLQFLTRAGAGSAPTAAISLGTLNLGNGANNIVVSNIGQGAAASVTFAGIGTRAAGATLNIGNGTYAAGFNPNYYFTAAPTVTNGIIGGWATVTSLIASTGGANIAFATYDPAVGVRMLQYQPTATYGAGVNLALSGNATIPAPLNVATTTSLNSLTIYNGTTLSFTNSNDTLLVQSGGILAGSDNNGRAIGSTATPGNIVSGSISNGGSATNNDLYIHVGANTLTVNSRIIDNGANNNVIIDAVSTGGATLTLTNANTYGGTTYLSGANVNLNSLVGPAIPGNIILSGGNNASADSLAFNQTSLNWQQPNQVASTASITMNGASQLNLGNAANVPNQSVPNTQTINNLTFNNDGGSNGANGPTIFTGAGTLTITGTLSSVSPAETFTVPTINGFIALTNATPTINVDANQFSPNNVGLSINANIAASSITKTGTGFLGIGGQNQNLVGTAFNLNAGGLAYSSSTGTAQAVLGGAVVMAANTTIDARGNNQGTGYGGLVVGSIASSSSSAVLLNNVQGTAGNISTGLDNTSTSYAGTIASPYPTGLLNLTKIGTGTWTLSGTNTTVSGTLAVQGGGVVVTGGGVENFQTYTLNSGTVTLDSSTTATSNRLGGAFFATSNTLAPTVRALNMQGGNLTITGNSGTAITENLGAVGITGGGILTLNAAGTAGINVTLQSLGGQTNQTSLFIRGTGLGLSAGANVATIQFATAGAAGTTPGLGFPTGGGGANGTLTKSVRPDIVISDSASGVNPTFLTVDTVSGLVRPLASNEMQTVNAASGSTQPLGYTLNAATTNGSAIVTVGSTAGLFIGEAFTNSNAGLAAGTFITAINPGLNQITVSANATSTQTGTNLATLGLAANTQNVLQSSATSTPLFVNTTTNSVTLNGGGGISSGIIAGNPWGSNGGLLTLTNTSTGILSSAGSNTIAVGAIAYGGITVDVHVMPGSTLTTNSIFTGAGGGFVKADGGTLVLNAPYTGNNAQNIAINGGTLQLGTNSGTLPGTLGSTSYNTNPLYVYINSGGVPSAENLAINNGTLDLNGNNQLVGTLTSQNPLPNSNIVITNTSATAATFTTNAAASIFSGSLQGNLNFDKAGNNTMTLTSPQTYTGTTAIRGGTLALRDSATLASSTINTNFAILLLDNTGLSAINNRVSSTAALNLTGGALRVNQTSSQSSQTFGTVTLNGGSNVFVANQYSNNQNSSTGTFTFNNLVVNNRSTILFSTQGTGGFTNAQDHLFINNLNGVPFAAASLVNGIIGPQFVTNTPGSNVFNFASYSNAGGITNPNVTIGGVTTPNYGGFGGGPTANVNFGANNLSTAGQTINTLRFGDPAAATTLGMNGTQDQLVLAAGGLLVSNNANQGLAIQGGSLTAGVANTPSTLYLQVGTQNTLTLNSPIVNNGATFSTTTGQWSSGGGALSLVRSTGNLTVTLAPQHVESLTVANIPVSSTTITVQNSNGLFVGMGVSGTGITAGSTITAIAGNTVTLSVATSATANAATAQVTFTPPTSAATSGTTAGSTTVTTAANAFATNFTPVVGMPVGGPNIPGGTTLASFTGTNATGFSFTLSQSALATSATNAITVGALNNSYTGNTIINAAVDQAAGGQTNLSGLPGSIVIPGNLTINGGATVVMNTNQGQIAQNSAITINGGGVLTLVGTNRFSPTLTFNNFGGNAAPTVNVGTLLDLGNAAAITATNDNTAFTPIVTGGTVNFSNAAGTTINVSGLSVNDLSIASQITTNALNTTTPNAGAVITKTGSGSLILPNANAASLTWALNGGWIFAGNATSLGTNAAAGALSFSGNVGLASSNTSNTVTIALPTIFTAATNLTLGNGFSASGLTLSGAMSLNGQAPTFTVPTASIGSTITGVISGTGGFTKAGPGILTLTPGTASTFTGPINITGGLLVLGNANGINASTATPGTNLATDVTVGTGAALNINAFPQSIGSLAGGGILTNSGATAALTIGTGSNATNATFSGALTAATQAQLSIIKTGTNNQTLSGTSFYTGTTTINGGTLTLKNGSTVATTATLNNTALTVNTGGTLAVSAVGANVGTNNAVNIGDAAGFNAGGSVALAGTGALTMQDGLVGTFNVLGGGAGTALTAGATSTLAFDIGSTGADRITLNRIAAVTAGSTINVGLISGSTSLPIGVIPLITSTAAATFTGAGTNNFTLGTPSIVIGTKTYNLTLAGAQNTTTQTALNITVTNAATYWSGSVDGTWSTGSGNGITNWRTDATSNIDAQSPPSIVSDVFFSTTTPVAANLTTTTGAPASMKSLNFISASAVTIGDGGVPANNLTIDTGGMTVQPGAGSAVINANVVLSAAQVWTHNGSNTLTVNGTSGGGSITSTNTGLTFTGSGNTAVSAALSLGSGSVTKSGTGRVSLTSASTYTGGTTVTLGLLLANNTTGSATGTGTVAVSGGTIGGYGSLAGPLTVTGTGTVAPGDPLGNPNNGNVITAVLGTGPLSLTGTTAALQAKVNAATPAGTGYDQVNVNGVVTFSGTVTGPVVPGVTTVNNDGPGLNLVLGSLYQNLTASVGDKVALVVSNSASNPIAGYFSSLNGTGLFTVDPADPALPQGPTLFTATDPISGFQVVLNYADNVDSGVIANDLTLTFSQVPEPTSLSVLGLGMAAGLLRRRRRR